MPNLIRFSQLKPRTVHAALIVMIQHNLLRHFKTDEDGETIIFALDECLMRLRFGEYVAIACELHGEKVWIYFVAPPGSEIDFQAAAIVTTLLDHGKLRQEDVIRLAIGIGTSGKTAQCHNCGK